MGWHELVLGVGEAAPVWQTEGGGLGAGRVFWDLFVEMGKELFCAGGVCNACLCTL